MRNPATCVSAHALVHGERGEGGTDMEGPRRRERKGGTRATAQRLAARAREAERRGTHAGEATSADRSALAGTERARERGEPAGEKATADRQAACGRRGRAT
jgi:hypothetical protein